MMNRGRINLIDDCGAWGDGQHDDTQAFITARIKLQQSGGGKLEIPSGNFLTSPVSLEAAENGNLSFNMQGTAAEASRIILATHNQTGFTFGGSGGSLRRCKISDLSFEYPSFPTAGYAIELRKLNGIIFENVRLAGFRSGITIGRDSDEYGMVLHTIFRDFKCDPGGTVESGITMDVRRACGITFDNVDLSGRYGATTGIRFQNTSTVDTITADHLLIKDHGTGVRAGAGPVHNLQATNLRMDGIATCAIHIELDSNVIASSWQVRNGWLASNNYGIILSAPFSNSVMERMDLEIESHNAVRPLTVFGNVTLSKVNGVNV